MLDTPLQSGADLFLWIVCILIAFIAAVSFLDFKSTQGPSDPYAAPGEHGERNLNSSRKHDEDVHKEFPREQTHASKDPARNNPSSSTSGDRL